MTRGRGGREEKRREEEGGVGKAFRGYLFGMQDMLEIEKMLE